MHAEDGQGSHHHQVGRRRQGEVLIRSRLVARDFKNKNDERNFDVFAATPPLEMKRLLFRMARVKGNVGGNDKDGQVKLMYVDVKKAHLNGEVDDDDFAYITLPKEVGGGVGATTAVVIWDAARSICLGRALRRELAERRPRAWTCCADGFHEQGDPVSGSWSGATTSRSSGGRGSSRRSGRRWPSGMTSRSVG